MGLEPGAGERKENEQRETSGERERSAAVIPWVGAKTWVPT